MTRVGMMREMGWEVDEEVNQDKSGDEWRIGLITKYDISATFLLLSFSSSLTSCAQSRVFPSFPCSDQWSKRSHKVSTFHGQPAHVAAENAGLENYEPKNFNGRHVLPLRFRPSFFSPAFSNPAFSAPPAHSTHLDATDSLTLHVWRRQLLQWGTGHVTPAPGHQFGNFQISSLLSLLLLYYVKISAISAWFREHGSQSWRRHCLASAKIISIALCR